MGTNIFLGDISYITKAITAVLQLGVTTDFSIFLYHKYEDLKKTNKDKKKAMELAINDTFKSVIGSSLTTIAGFLALCSMDLTLGKDIGLVMAKGVLFGSISGNIRQFNAGICGPQGQAQQRASAKARGGIPEGPGLSGA